MDTHSSPGPASVHETIAGIVAAVRAGDDPLIRALLESLAEEADAPAALLMLRHQLNQDLGNQPRPQHTPEDPKARE